VNERRPSKYCCHRLPPSTTCCPSRPTSISIPYTLRTTRTYYSSSCDLVHSNLYDYQLGHGQEFDRRLDNTRLTPARIPTTVQHSRRNELRLTTGFRNTNLQRGKSVPGWWGRRGEVVSASRCLLHHDLSLGMGVVPLQ
jgi:hypothetical protein